MNHALIQWCRWYSHAILIKVKTMVYCLSNVTTFLFLSYDDLPDSWWVSSSVISSIIGILYRWDSGLLAKVVRTQKKVLSNSVVFEHYHNNWCEKYLQYTRQISRSRGNKSQFSIDSELMCIDFESDWVLNTCSKLNATMLVWQQFSDGFISNSVDIKRVFLNWKT